MNNGKYVRKRRLRWRKEFVLICSIAILLIGMVGGSLAYLFMGTDPVTNTFTAPEIDVTIPEDFNGSVKSNVKVTNDCDFEVFVRASYVAYFAKIGDPSVVHTAKPVLNISINEGSEATQWTNMGGGYYLYNSTIAASNPNSDDDTTANFINSASLTGEAPEGYTLVIDVIAEVVQAKPAQARQDVWGY